mgnify:CR=1 FL=1
MTTMKSFVTNQSKKKKKDLWNWNFVCIKWGRSVGSIILIPRHVMKIAMIFAIITKNWWLIRQNHYLRRLLIAFHLLDCLAKFLFFFFFSWTHETRFKSLYDHSLVKVLALRYLKKYPAWSISVRYFLSV